MLSKNLIAIEAIIENALTCQLIIIQVPGRQEHELTGELNDGMWELNLIKFDSEHWSILYNVQEGNGMWTIIASYIAVQLQAIFPPRQLPARHMALPTPLYLSK